MVSVYFNVALLAVCVRAFGLLYTLVQQDFLIEGRANPQTRCEYGC